MTISDDRPAHVEQLQSLVDKDQIRDQLCRYSRGVDRFDAELVNSVYWPDAWDEHGPAGTVAGHEAGQVLIQSMTGYCSAAHHLLGNILIDLRGDVAYVESYFLNTLVMEDEQGNDMTRLFGGRYVDRFEKRHDEWRIAHRVMVHEWSRLDEIDRPWPPGLTHFIQGRRDRSDMAWAIEKGVEHAHALLPTPTPMPLRTQKDDKP